MKKIFIIMLLQMIVGLNAFACATCELAQPRYLRGITHGAGPENNWDLVIVSVIAFIVIVTLFFSIKWIIQPGEKSKTHIKHLILNLD